MQITSRNDQTGTATDHRGPHQLSSLPRRGQNRWLGVYTHLPTLLTSSHILSLPNSELAESGSTTEPVYRRRFHYYRRCCLHHRDCCYHYVSTHCPWPWRSWQLLWLHSNITRTQRIFTEFLLLARQCAKYFLYLNTTMTLWGMYYSQPFAIRKLRLRKIRWGDSRLYSQ